MENRKSKNFTVQVVLDSNNANNDLDGAVPALPDMDNIHLHADLQV